MYHFRLDINDAEEIAQITVIKFHQKDIENTLAESKYKKWICTTTDNNCLDLMKKRRN